MVHTKNCANGPSIIAPQEAERYTTRLEKWLRGIISRYKKSSHKLLKKFGATLENAAAEMFTFVMYPCVNSTTNLGEQSIRKLIGHRNTRVQLKSDREPIGSVQYSAVLKRGNYESLVSGMSCAKQ